MSEVPPSKEMAEEDSDTSQPLSPDTIKDKIKSTNMEQDVPTCEENQQEESDIALKHEHSGASSSVSTNEESNNVNSETTEQTDVKSIGSPEGKIMPFTTGSISHVDSRTTSQAKECKDVGDHNREMTTKFQPTTKPEILINDLTGQKKETETTGLPSLGDGANFQVDQPKASLSKESSDVEYTNIGAEGDIRRGPEPDSSEKEVSEEEEENQETHERRHNVENIGPIAQETTESTITVLTRILRGNVKFLIPVVLAFVAVLLMTPRPPESPPRINNIDILLRQMEKVKTLFPHQRNELWKRSKIHLKRHLQTDQPTAPVNLILTAGVRGERTLHCLAQNLATAFSFAVNASVLHIDGASAATQDSDQVKLDIDSKLQGAFEGDKPVAVIHRFEELPPGSTLIFYRYCDHENAAYKGTVLIFTVLLEEEDIPDKISLNSVEEMVDDHLKKKFLSHSHPVSFDRMDLDKYGGLWSRISHLILPVAAEERIEHEGCWGT